MNQIRRMDDTRFVLAYMTTVLSSYFNLNSEIEAFLERYNEKFPQSHEVKANSAKVFGFIEHCGFPSSSRVWSQANLFTLLVETYRATAIEGQALDPKDLGPKLENFYARVGSVDPNSETDADLVAYQQATIQNTNGRANRLRRGTMIAALLKL